MSGNRLRGKSDIFEFDVEDIPPFAVMPLLNLIRELTTKHKLGNGLVKTTVFFQVERLERSDFDAFRAELDQLRIYYGTADVE